MGEPAAFVAGAHCGGSGTDLFRSGGTIVPENSINFLKKESQVNRYIALRKNTAERMKKKFFQLYFFVQVVSERLYVYENMADTVRMSGICKAYLSVSW